MKMLLLLRHARAEPTGAGGDHQRALSAAGAAQAANIARRLCTVGPRPDAILCSTALRARQTAAPIANGVERQPVFSRSLYESGPDDYLHLIRATATETGVLLLVGHNPVLEILGSALGGRPCRLAPGHMAAIEVDGNDWTEIGQGSPGRLLEVRPALQDS